MLTLLHNLCFTIVEHTCLLFVFTYRKKNQHSEQEFHTVVIICWTLILDQITTKEIQECQIHFVSLSINSGFITLKQKISNSDIVVKSVWIPGKIRKMYEKTACDST